jgi:hypothetical protein
MGQFINVNGDYNLKVTAGNTITLDTQSIGQVQVSGDLIVNGIIRPNNIEFTDNIIVLNQGETEQGVDLNFSGFEIDRGSLTNVALLWSEESISWTLVNGTETDGYFINQNSRLSLYEIITDIVSNSTGDLTLKPVGDLIYSGSSELSNSLFRITDGENTRFQIDSSTGVIGVDTPALDVGSSVIDLSTTWNNASEIFYGIKIDVINDGSSNDSRFLSFLISGSEKFSIDLDGNIRIDGSLLVIGDIDVTTINIDNNTENAFKIQTNTDEYLNINTTTGLETVTFSTGNIIISEDLKVNGGNITTDQTTFNLVNTTATTVNFAGDATAINIGAATGTTTVNNNLVVDDNLAVNGGDLTTDATTFNLLDTTATTVNFAGDGTSVNIGSATGIATIRNAEVVLDGDLRVNGGSIATDQTTFNLINDTATTVNFASSADSINIGSAASTVSVANNLEVEGNLTVKGTTTSLETITLEVEDPLVKFGKNNIGDSYSIGFYGEYVDNTSSSKKTGFFRDHISKDFYLFDDLTGDITTGNVIDTVGLSLANLRANNVIAENLIGVIDGGTY